MRHIWGHTTQPSNMPMLCHKGTVIGLVATNGVPASIRSMELIRAGYWKSDTDERWPDPRSMVDPKLPEAERDEVVSYLRRGFVVRLWMGYSPCRICGANNGDLDVTDGVYIWPDGLAHYVDAHNVRGVSSRNGINNTLSRFGALGWRSWGSVFRFSGRLRGSASRGSGALKRERAEWTRVNFQ